MTPDKLMRLSLWIGAAGIACIVAGQLLRIVGW